MLVSAAGMKTTEGSSFKIEPSVEQAFQCSAPFDSVSINQRCQ